MAVAVVVAVGVVVGVGVGVAVGVVVGVGVAVVVAVVVGVGVGVVVVVVVVVARRREMNRLDYVLASLRRAGENGYSWSVSPDEATALVAEVKRLRADLDALARAVGQAVVASSLATGETLADPIPHIIVSTVMRLRAEALGQRAEASYLRACVPPTHPTDYGHEAWSAALRAEVAAERAAVVATLRRTSNHAVDLDSISDAIERGEHRREEAK